MTASCAAWIIMILFRGPIEQLVYSAPTRLRSLISCSGLAFFTWRVPELHIVRPHWLTQGFLTKQQQQLQEAATNDRCPSLTGQPITERKHLPAACQRRQSSFNLSPPGQAQGHVDEQHHHPYPMIQPTAPPLQLIGWLVVEYRAASIIPFSTRGDRWTVVASEAAPARRAAAGPSAISDDGAGAARIPVRRGVNPTTDPMRAGSTKWSLHLLVATSSVLKKKYKFRFSRSQTIPTLTEIIQNSTNICITI